MANLTFLSLCANASGDSNTTSELWLLEDKTSAQVAASFLLLILVVGLPWNLLMVGIILKKKLYTQPTIILLLNLVLTDIFMLVMTTPSQVWVGFNAEYNYGDTDSTRCQVCKAGVILTLLPLIAMYTISYMAFDRFLFIYKPLKYDRIITCFRTLLVLVLTWILTTLIAALPLFGFGDYVFNGHLLICFFDSSRYNSYIPVILITTLIPVVPIVVCNIGLLCIVQKNIKTIYSARRSTSATQKSDEDKLYGVIKKQRHQKQLHLVWVFGALMCCNLVSWLPIIIRVIFFTVGVEPSVVFSSVAIVLFTSQALLHPTVETALIKEVREPHKMITLYCCMKIKSKFSSNITSPSPEPRHGCCGYCGDDAQSPGHSGCGLLDIMQCCSVDELPSLFQE